VTNRRGAVASCALLAVVSWGVAFAYVARNEWFDVHDLRPFAFWCILAGAVAYPTVRWIQRWAASSRTGAILGVASVTGVAFGIAWTFVVMLILGGWIGGFGFPVLLCWITGSVFGHVGSAVFVRPRLLPAAAGLALALPISTGVVLAWLSAAPPEAVVYLRPGATADQVRSFWDESFTSVEDRRFLKTMSAADDGARRGIRLSFQPRTSKERRASILSAARSLPFVEEVLDAPPDAREDWP
jgi:hypothetical protein